MYGTATLAMLVSITSINVAIITAMAISHGLCFGCHFPLPPLPGISAHPGVLRSGGTVGLQPHECRYMERTPFWAGPEAARPLKFAGFPSGPASLHPYLGLHGHPRRQPLLAWLVRPQPYAHRQPLHYLHVVACRVLRRQQAVDRAGRSRQRLHVAVEVQLECIHVDRHRLSLGHVLHLRFLEVRRDPDVVGLRQREHLLPRRNLGGHLHLLVAHNAVFRRVHLCVLQVELGLVRLRQRLLRVGDAHRKLLLLHLHLPGPVDLRLPCLRLALLHLRGRLRHLLLRGLRLLAPRRHRRGLRPRLRGALVILLTRNFFFLHQQPVAFFFTLGIALICFGFMQVGKRRTVLLLLGQQVGLRPFHVVVARHHLRRLVGRGNRHVRRLLAHGGLRLRQVGRCLLLGHLHVARVDLQQQ